MTPEQIALVQDSFSKVVPIRVAAARLFQPQQQWVVKWAIPGVDLEREIDAKDKLP